jgi:hypothetical protein
MTSTQTQPGTRRTGNGRAEAVSHVVDQWFDFCVQAVEIQRRVVKASLDMLGPLYSAVEEADQATRLASRGLDE